MTRASSPEAWEANQVPGAFTVTRSAPDLSQPLTVWFDDPNGTPDHRRHLAKHYAEEIRIELSAGVRL